LRAQGNLLPAPLRGVPLRRSSPHVRPRAWPRTKAGHPYRVSPTACSVPAVVRQTYMAGPNTQIATRLEPNTQQKCIMLGVSSARTGGAPIRAQHTRAHGGGNEQQSDQRGSSSADKHGEVVPSGNGVSQCRHTGSRRTRPSRRQGSPQWVNLPGAMPGLRQGH
jgi:hypothetical protein